MNLSKKKELARKTLKVGKDRIVFSEEGMSEIKEAITKDDIRSLHSEGIISVKPVKGRKTVEKRKTRRGPGKIKKKINNRKQEYVKITRKLREYIKELKNKEEINRDLYKGLRKKIRMRNFRSKAYLKDYIKRYLENPELVAREGKKVKKKRKTKGKKK